MQIAQYTFPNSVFVAPMAGVTDRPFRQLCRRLSAGHAYSEMAASNPKLWHTVKSSRRLDHKGEIDPITVQIAGGDPVMMAEAALYNIDKGAQIIDINMGCPAKKVCHAAAGSALLQNEDLVYRILDAVVSACSPKNIPVTLKTRTGWSKEHKNVMTIAQKAQQIGIAALTIHGRTREDFYHGQAEYDTITAVKQSLQIPVIANGDIDSPEKAKLVLEQTHADAIMIGRAAQGNPWIFREIVHFLNTGERLAAPSAQEMRDTLLQHLLEHYEFYGEFMGVRTARKHIGWYLQDLPKGSEFCQQLYRTDQAKEQWQQLANWFDDNAEQLDLRSSTMKDSP